MQELEENFVLLKEPCLFEPVQLVGNGGGASNVEMFLLNKELILSSRPQFYPNTQKEKKWHQ